MSHWRSVWLVAKREILERGRSRGFVFSVLFTTLLVIGSFVLPAVLFGEDEPTRIGLVRPSPPGLEQAITRAAHDQPVAYGLFAVALAVITGWGASLLFRKD